MSNNAIDKSSLKYLGEEYQFKLVKEFMEDKTCFKDLAPIIDQNMFTGQYLRMYVGIMLEYLNKHGIVPSYTSMDVEMRQRAHTEADVEISKAVIERIKNTTSEGSNQTRELATKFFKQQNIIKAANEMLKLAGNGDLENYDRCEELLRDALATGSHEDYEESRLFDGIDETLSNDSRITMPTGIGLIDETLNGGLGKGELAVIVGSSGFGKALGVNELVFTERGFVRMGDITMSDRVIGDDGRSHKLLGIFPQGKRQLYRVTFSDNTNVLCDIEHLWNVNSYKQRNENDLGYKTVTLQTIMDEGLMVGNDYNFRIPLNESVEFYGQDTPIKPYEFGLMLHKDINASCDHIPHTYLYNTHRYRNQLLCGLMDAGGVIDDNGHCYYTTKYKLLANDIQLLVQSLGGFSVVSNENNVYKISVNLTTPYIKTFGDDERQNKVKIHDDWKYIKSIEKDVIDDAICIAIDSPNHLYLTNNFTVTHNTTLTTSMALTAAKTRTPQNLDKGFKVMQIVFEDRIKQIQRKHFSKITQVEACNLSKEEYAQHVRDILDAEPERELIQENLRIIRLKSGEKSIDFIENLIKKHINQGFRPDMVIIDYFECIKLTGPSQTAKWDKESSIMRKIEAMANELNIGFWVPVQGNRDSINAELVTMDKAGGSLSKIQIAHIIMSITRSLDDIADNRATLSILKNRAGSSGRVIDGAVFNNGTCTISTDECDDFSSGVAFTKHRENQAEENRTNLQKDIFKGMQH